MEMMEIAAVLEERRAGVVEVPIPEPREDWALVKVHAAPMCTEVKGWKAGTDWALGHEAAGEVVAIAQPGPVEVGDRVVVMPQLSCGRCALCRAGDYIYCENNLDYRAFTGSEGNNQTMAQYILKPARLLPKIPDGVSYDHASLACCGLGPTFGALDSLGVDTFDTLLITGLGPVGLGGVLNATFRGARVIAVDLVAWRRDRAQRLGAERTLDATSDTLLDEIRDWTGGLGVDAAIDCSGNAAAQRLCLDALRRRGGMAFVGQTRNAIEVHPSRDLLNHGRTVLGEWHYNLNLYPALMQLIERSELLDTLISHTFPMAEIQAAFETIATQETAKVILHPWG
jgi:threonine dehydrogenase-like Zn-dependent dehydrogenase